MARKHATAEVRQFLSREAQANVHPSDEKRRHKHRSRIQHSQQRWAHIKEDLPPQFSRRHIGMISIGGVIGTGLFLGSSDALYHGGPVGALLAYFLIGTLVYCLCVSMGEMISFLPNVGGVVGLADLYVDPSLGFSLGWMSWYSWTVTFPAEIAAATVVANFWNRTHAIPIPILLTIFLTFAIAANCLPSRFYGELEYWLSSLKIITIICLMLFSIVIDLGAGAEGYIGFKNWSRPFAPSYLGMMGSKGHFLGFWTVMMQAFFAFSGSEIAGIAAGEVIDATRNVPRALKNVWIRITFFYLGGIFCAGLLVPQTDQSLQRDDGTALSSPFVIAMKIAGVRVVPHIVNAVVLVAAWSAAAADLYISSRFLFFVARCRHAPAFLATVFRYPAYRSETEDPRRILDEEFKAGRTASILLPDALPYSCGRSSIGESYSLDGSQGHDVKTRKPLFITPLACVLVSASFGSLSFLSSRNGSDAQSVFKELCAATSAGSLITWTSILFTYLRWYQGSVYAERKYCRTTADDRYAKSVMDSIAKIKEQRHWGQPYCAIYGLCMCMIIILTNGWSVFISYEWHIGKVVASTDTPSPVQRFLASYLPIPCFVFLTLGYKLIYRTKMVALEEMCFAPGGVPPLPAEALDEMKPKRGWRKILGWVLLA